MRYAEVIVDISSDELNRGFVYKVPEELKSVICIGAFVSIPFGNSLRKGYVVSFPDSAGYDEEKIKYIDAVITDRETSESRLVELAVWMSEYYSCNFIRALRTVFPVRKKIKARIKKNRYITSDNPPEGQLKQVMSTEQREAFEEILDEWNNRGRTCLIHGVTGSGKTLIYMELIAKILSEGKQAILLIPEIALTFQTVNRFIERFGNKVAFLNSRMSQGEKYESLRRAKCGEIEIMIGPRSALFTPFSNLGLIIVDEEHEESYHSESTPRYDAVRTSQKRAEIENAHVILGSATPSVDSYFRAEKEIYRLVELKNRYSGGNDVRVECVDMREELLSGNGSFLSVRLKEAIRRVIDEKNQAMLFLNRRGYSGFISCRSCGHVFKCPHCEVSLTEHLNGLLICHYCGYSEPFSGKCPECGSSLVGGMRIGTEQVEEYIKKEFPDARVLRMDMDTTAGKNGHARILAEFSEGKADILIGTQMIVKGHDYPKVALVGVLMADMSLNDNDFRSAERTFQLLVQAVGRAGRGSVSGTAIIQTYDPEHYSITSAKEQDYKQFFAQEMLFRNLMGYPPAGVMMAVYGSSEDEILLKRGMGFLMEYLKKLDPDNVIGKVGPAPLAVRKIKDMYREGMFLRSKEHAVLKKACDLMQNYIEINSGFNNINIQFDYNI
ncbi:MAG: replication restart helicase PriA [Lachnospiraceae bacterium]